MNECRWCGGEKSVLTGRDDERVACTACMVVRYPVHHLCGGPLIPGHALPEMAQRAMVWHTEHGIAMMPKPDHLACVRCFSGGDWNMVGSRDHDKAAAQSNEAWCIEQEHSWRPGATSASA
jgi:hypothetical protein